MNPMNFPQIISNQRSKSPTNLKEFLVLFYFYIHMTLKDKNVLAIAQKQKAPYPFSTQSTTTFRNF